MQLYHDYIYRLEQLKNYNHSLPFIIIILLLFDGLLLYTERKIFLFKRHDYVIR